MKITFFKTCFTAICGLALLNVTSCTDDDDAVISKSGNISEIQVDRERIGTCQLFTLSCAAEMGSNMATENLQWRDATMSYPTELKDGKTSFTAYVEEAGKVTFSCVYSGYGKDAKPYEVKKDIVLDVVKCDIRNSFWGDSKNETLKNINDYYTKDAHVENDDIYFMEKDVALTTHFKQPKSVIYSVKNDQLSSVFYEVDMTDYSDTKVIGSLRIRLEDLKRNGGYDGFIYKLKVNEGAVLTDEEKALAEEYLNGGLEVQFDKEGVFGKAVKEGKVELLILAQNASSQVALNVALNQKSNLLLGQFFTPKK